MTDKRHTVQGLRHWACFGLLLLMLPIGQVWATAELESEDAPLPLPLVAAPAQSVVLHSLVGVHLARNSLQLVLQSGAVPNIKNRMILSSPGRLVIDLAGVTLGDAKPLLAPEALGDVPVRQIRLGQFTEDTLRVVVETPAPEQLRVSVQDNALLISAENNRRFFGHLRDFLFGEAPPPPPLPAPATLPKSTPPASDTLPRPGLENLRRIQMSPAYLPTDGNRRGRIIEIARSQIGLSKDTHREYINQTFSRGKDNEWCADFVSTILDWAGGSPWGHLSRVQDIYDWAVSSGRLTTQLAPADIVVFSYGPNRFDHIAFVESVNPDNTITTIGGNEGYAIASSATSGSVARSTYRLDDKRILGFINPGF